MKSPSLLRKKRVKLSLALHVFSETIMKNASLSFQVRVPDE